MIVFSIPLMYSKKFQRENGVMWQNFQNSKSSWTMYDCVEEEKEMQIIVMSQKMNTVKKVKRDCPIWIWSIIREWHLYHSWNSKILGKLPEYKRNWTEHVDRMPRHRLPRVMKHYSPTGRRKHGRPLKRLLDTWDRNGSKSGPNPWQIYDDDDDDDDEIIYMTVNQNNKAVYLQKQPLYQGTSITIRVKLNESAWPQNVGIHGWRSNTFL